MPASPQALEDALGTLAQMEGIEGAAVVARDGMLLAARLPASVDRDTFGAMSATMVGAASTAAYEMRRRPPDSFVVEMDAWRILAADAGEGAFVVAVAQGKLRPEAASLRLLATARQVKALLGA